MTRNIPRVGWRKFFSWNVITLRKYAMLCTAQIRIIWTKKRIQALDRLFFGINHYSPLNGPSNFCGFNHRRISGISLGSSLSLHSLTSPEPLLPLWPFCPSIPRRPVGPTGPTTPGVPGIPGIPGGPAENKKQGKTCVFIWCGYWFWKWPLSRKSRLTGFN